MISFDIFSVKLQHLKCIINAIEKKMSKVLKCTVAGLLPIKGF